MGRVEILPVRGLPEVRLGNDLASLIKAALVDMGLRLLDGDVLVVSQKVVSKAEGSVVRREEVAPSPRARELAEDTGKSPAHVEVILRQTKRVVRVERERGVLIMETPHGFVCANAGVDRSNVGEGEVYSTLPEDPDASARALRMALEEAFSVRLAVIVSDSFGRPWRLGQTDVALGVSGMRPFRDHRGQRDPFGYELRSSNVALADELAAAAEMVKGKVDGIPVAVVRGVRWEPGEGRGADLLRTEEEDLFR